MGWDVVRKQKKRKKTTCARIPLPVARGCFSRAIPPDYHASLPSPSHLLVMTEHIVTVNVRSSQEVITDAEHVHELMMLFRERDRWNIWETETDGSLVLHVRIVVPVNVELIQVLESEASALQDGVSDDGLKKVTQRKRSRFIPSSCSRCSWSRGSSGQCAGLRGSARAAEISFICSQKWEWGSLVGYTHRWWRYRDSACCDRGSMGSRRYDGCTLYTYDPEKQSLR